MPLWYQDKMWFLLGVVCVVLGQQLQSVICVSHDGIPVWIKSFPIKARLVPVLYVISSLLWNLAVHVSSVSCFMSACSCFLTLKLRSWIVWPSCFLKAWCYNLNLAVHVPSVTFICEYWDLLISKLSIIISISRFFQVVRGMNPAFRYLFNVTCNCVDNLIMPAWWFSFVSTTGVPIRLRCYSQDAFSVLPVIGTETLSILEAHQGPYWTKTSNLYTSAAWSATNGWMRTCTNDLISMHNLVKHAV